MDAHERQRQTGPHDSSSDKLRFRAPAPLWFQPHLSTISSGKESNILVFSVSKLIYGVHTPCYNRSTFIQDTGYRIGYALVNSRLLLHYLATRSRIQPQTSNPWLPDVVRYSSTLVKNKISPVTQYQRTRKPEVAHETTEYSCHPFYSRRSSIIQITIFKINCLHYHSTVTYSLIGSCFNQSQAH